MFYFTNMAVLRWKLAQHSRPRGRILRQKSGQILKRFPPWYSQSPLQLCLEISISSNSGNLLRMFSNSRNLLCISTVRLMYTVKKKGEKPDRKPYPPPPSIWFKKSIQKPQVWELSRLCPETSTKLYVHEFGFRSGLFAEQIAMRINGEGPPFVSWICSYYWHI